jgi:zinc protease
LGGVGTLFQKGSDPPEARLGGRFRTSVSFDKQKGICYDEPMKQLKIESLAALLAGLLMAINVFPADGGGGAQHKLSVLDNGLSAYIQKRDAIPLVHIVFAINMGSKDEDEKTSGLIHLLEHLLLLGPSEDHTVDEIIREMRGHGAQFNAHTSHDLMTFELSLPARFWEFGLQVLKEKLFHFKFTPQQLEREREIIFEEISQHQDDPYSLGTNLALQLLFGGHPYQHPIYGDSQVIRQATVAELETFYRRYLVPANCSLAVVGDVNIEAVEHQIQQIYGTLENKKRPAAVVPRIPPLKKNMELTRNLDLQEARLIIGFHAPPQGHQDQLSLDLLKIILGRGINPLLAGALFRRGKPLAYNLHTRYLPLEYGGAFLVYLTVEPKNLKYAQRELINFFKTLWKFNYSSKDYLAEQQVNYTDYLEAAKSQVKYSYQQFQELGLNAAVTYATYLLFHQARQGEPESEAEPYLERVEKTTSADIRDIASRYLSGKKHVVITIRPGKK